MKEYNREDYNRIKEEELSENQYMFLGVIAGILLALFLFNYGYLIDNYLTLIYRKLTY